ncbi:MAG: c-type cytochrome [Caulobacteraceae bacterium]
MKLGWLALGLTAAGLFTVPAVAAVSMELADPAAAQPVSSAAPVPAASDGAAVKGKQVFQEICGSCHDLAVSTVQMKSHDDWQATVSRMANEGAALTDDQVAQVVAYLTKTYGAN